MKNINFVNIKAKIHPLFYFNYHYFQNLAPNENI